MNYQEFEKKVKSMTAHDIIMAMIEGLREPRTRVDMTTFGEIREGICYGCAATNAILNIMDIKEDKVVEHIISNETLVYRGGYLGEFENAIDHLRRGEVDRYNAYAMNYDFAQIIPMPGQKLPHLDNDYTEDQLQEYEKLAKYQLTVNQ